MPPDISNWLNSQEFIDRYNAYITDKIQRDKDLEELKKVRSLEREIEEENKKKLREEYEA